MSTSTVLAEMEERKIVLLQFSDEGGGSATIL